VTDEKKNKVLEFIEETSQRVRKESPNLKSL
jgi:hypothetical protein